MKPIARNLTLGLAAAGACFLTTGCGNSKVEFSKTVIEQQTGEQRPIPRPTLSPPVIPSRTDEVPPIDIPSQPDGIEHPPYDHFENWFYVHPLATSRNALPWQRWPVINHRSPFEDRNHELMPSEASGMGDHVLNMHFDINPSSTHVILSGSSQKRCVDPREAPAGWAPPAGSMIMDMGTHPEPFRSARRVVCYDLPSPMGSTVRINVENGRFGEIFYRWLGSTAMKRSDVDEGLAGSRRASEMIEMKMTARIPARESFSAAAGEALLDRAGELLASGSESHIAPYARCAMERVHYLQLTVVGDRIREGKLFTVLRYMDVGVYESQGSQSTLLPLGEPRTRARALAACRNQLDSRVTCMPTRPGQVPSPSCERRVSDVLNFNYRTLIDQGAPFNLGSTLEVYDYVRLQVQPPSSTSSSSQ